MINVRQCFSFTKEPSYFPSFFWGGGGGEGATESTSNFILRQSKSYSWRDEKYDALEAG